MKAAMLALFGLMAGPLHAADPVWLPVSARSDGACRGDGVSVPEPAQADCIRFVGRTGPPPAVPARTVTFAPLIRPPVPAAAAKKAEAPPSGAIWPDGNGERIVPEPRKDTRFGTANPWQIHKPAEAAQKRSIRCGGIIVACEGNSVAIINGRVCRAGDKAEDLVIRSIGANEIQFFGDGHVFVLPAGATAILGTDR